MKRFALAFVILLFTATLANAQLMLMGTGAGKAGGGGGGGGATGYTWSGPSTGTAGSASTNFTVTASGGTFTGSQTVTIADGSQGGTITPSVGSPGTSTVTVTPTNGAASFTFTYTAVVGDAITLTGTNGQSWSNPSPLTYTGAVTYTMTGPGSGTTEVASTNFTVSMPAGTQFSGTDTVTIADASNGGTFTPSVGSPGTSTVTVTPAAAATSFTYTYTPHKVAALTLTATNAQSWTNPSPLTYTAATCSQYTTLAGKLDGGQNVAATTALICGLVADTVWSKMQLFYNFATNTAANAVLNWVSTSFNASLTSAPGFSANNGYISNGTTSFISTNYNPSISGSLNSTAIGVCDLTANATTTTGNLMGGGDGTNTSAIIARGGSTTVFTRINNSVSQTDTIASTNIMMTASRTVSTGFTAYNNGTAISTHTVNSAALPNIVVSVLTLNANGTQNFSTDRIAMAFISTGLSGTDVSNLYTRYHTYELAVGATNPC